ncbi:MAG: hypothetical protein J6Y19_03730 [Kiritimatiellae bacterium]|nr:hypothetical protein [Kiritimatiellia bacterium]
MSSGWNKWVVGATAAICAVAMWGCKWEMGAESKRKKEFSEYMRVAVRDPSRMLIEWRYSFLRQGTTLVGVAIFWSVNGYGGYEFPTYYHLVVMDGGRVFSRETKWREDVLQIPKGLEDYLEKEKGALSMCLDDLLEEAKLWVEMLEELKVPDLPGDLEGGNWANPQQKRSEWAENKRHFEESKEKAHRYARRIAEELEKALKNHKEWKYSPEGEYYFLGLGLDVSIDERAKTIKERSIAAQKTYEESWNEGMARLHRVEERLKAAEKAAEASRQQTQAAWERAQYEALKAERAREAAAAQEVAATEEEAQRWRAAAGEKMRSFMEDAERFYAENHPTEASKYEIEDYRKFAAQLLLVLHRATVAMKEKQEVLAGGVDGSQREELERDIAAAEGRIGELWQTLLVGIGAKKYTLQLERQGGRTLPRMKKSLVPFTPGSPTFSRYEPYLRELAGETK